MSHLNLCDLMLIWVTLPTTADFSSFLYYLLQTKMFLDGVDNLVEHQKNKIISIVSHGHFTESSISSKVIITMIIWSSAKCQKSEPGQIFCSDWKYGLRKWLVQ